MSVTEAPSYGEMRTETEKRVDAKVLAQVKRGIAFLEERYGSDWVERIDLATLDLDSSESCVIGQVFGDYDECAPKLWPECEGWGGVNREAAKYGFWSYVPEGEHDPLQEAWLAVLTPMVTKN